MYSSPFAARQRGLWPSDIKTDDWEIEDCRLFVVSCPLTDERVAEADFIRAGGETKARCRRCDPRGFDSSNHSPQRQRGDIRLS